MFSGSVARGVRQLTSQMNDHRCVLGNLGARQNSAYELLRPSYFFPKFNAMQICKNNDAGSPAEVKRPDLSIRPFKVYPLN